ncbi:MULTISPECIES: conjugative transposon protein TraN [unclassified Flavobacterium]|uniref:conjugative transposon protein TraN n=1 Tax=unclassified Flavobacterium TaxID=196869 RepID=UPI00058059FC|nr:MULTISPECIES: conjugative transposon protein TraN [unclassified Flavobacterium]KIA95721.1 conjugative transposon protein TraN [Flavobacterium sp. KMS]OUL62637.1 conjugative transposon protein TraN [Flavobacterium sp. AJR]
MKNFNLLMIGYLLFMSIGVFAQKTSRNNLSKIESDSLLIAYSKTTNIVFPFAIKSVDKGSQDILVQKAKGVENILQIKAAQKGFFQTNLTVVTADEKLYSFVLSYNEESPQLNLSINKPKNAVQEVYFSDDIRNEQDVQEYSKLAFYDKKKLRGEKESNYDIDFVLNGIFIRDAVMYYRIKVTNNSKVDYDINQLRFFIRDSKKVKRTASQEIEITPIYVLNNVVKIEGEAENTFVFALPKFTIPEKKYLAIQLMEQNGGRHVELHVKNTKLVQVTVLPKL